MIEVESYYSFVKKHKRDLHEYAIKAVISDGLSFGIFRKPAQCVRIEKIFHKFITFYLKLRIKFQLQKICKIL